MRQFLQAAAALTLMIIGAAIFAVILKASGLRFAPDAEIGPSQFVSIILTALGVIIAAVTLFIGALAVYGWVTFETRVVQASEEFLDKRFSSSDARYNQLVEDIKEDVRLQILTGQTPIDPENLADDPNLA